MTPGKHCFNFSATQERLLSGGHTLSLIHEQRSHCSQRTFYTPAGQHLDAAVRQFKNNKPSTVPPLVSKLVSLQSWQLSSDNHEIEIFSCLLHSAKIVQASWPLLFPRLNVPQLLLWLFTWERQKVKREQTFPHKIVFLTSLPALSVVSSDNFMGVTLLILAANQQKLFIAWIVMCK